MTSKHDNYTAFVQEVNDLHYRIEDPLDGAIGSDPSSRLFHQNSDDELHRLYVGQKTRCKVFLGRIITLDKKLNLSHGTVGEFILFQHQAGGHSCEKYWMFVRPLVVNDAFIQFARNLADDYAHHNNGLFKANSVDEDDRRVYRSRLFRWSLTARLNSTQPLSESLYPIDATQENLDRICRDQYHLSDLLMPAHITPDGLESAAIWIISDNSD